MSASYRTDWTAYYRKPASPARVTRRITQALLIRLMRVLAGANAPISICELGGANSCFVDAIVEQLPVKRYHIIDTNEFGLSLLEHRFGNDHVVSWERGDVLGQPSAGGLFDIVFSVGLIEHFDPTGTAAAVSSHLQLARSGGGVIITFPTPTWLYRGSRGAIEMAGSWKFPDERPLGFAEVERAIVSNGATILSRRINWPIVLTQGIVTARKVG
jgi:hypothetical protein